MKIILIIIAKEFRQIFRNKGMLPIIFVMPIIQLFILVNAATFDIKNLKVYFVDNDHSTVSRIIKENFVSSGYFIAAGESNSQNLGEKALQENMADLYINIPPNLEKEMIRNPQNTSEIHIVINSIDGTKAGVCAYYSTSILKKINQELMKNGFIQLNETTILNQKNINIEYSNWYNPELNYTTFMIPGILVLLVTMIGTFLSAMNIVREKEVGTIEQINVTPIRKYQFIVGKLTPLWILAMFELTFGLIIAKIFYFVPIEGNILVLFGFAAIYLIGCLGLGLLISTISDTQQQAVFITWFIMVIFILLGGLFTSIDNMPQWVQYITYINPVRYFIEVIRLVMLKGAAFADIQRQFIIVSSISVILLTLAVLRYRKTSN